MLATPPRSIASQDPSTPSSSSRRNSRIPKDAGWVSRRLEQHGLIYTEAETLDRFPIFRAKVEDILNASRDSAMKPESVRRFARRRQYEQSSNEDTFLINLIPLIIKDHYTQRSTKVPRDFSGTLQEGALLDEEVPELKEWFDEGLTYKFNLELRKCQLPNSYYKNDDDTDSGLIKALSKEDGMKNPKPDYLFGLRTDQFDSCKPPDVILSSEIVNLLEIAPNMNHPFLLIEGKSNKGVIGDAEIQARRGGAAIVNVGRKLLGFTKARESLLAEGPDTETFIFSATITPQSVDIFIHWAEVITSASTEAQHSNEPEKSARAGVQSSTDVQGSSVPRYHTPDSVRVVYHMTYLRNYNLRDRAILPALRRVLHNILEFGCVDRAAQLLTLRKELYSYQRSESTRLNNENHESDNRSIKRQRRDP